MITKQQLITLSQKGSVKAGLVSAVSFAAGAALSFVIVDRKLKTKYEAISEQEIKDAKLYYAQLNKTDEFADPEKLFEDLVKENEEMERVREAGEDIVRKNKYRTVSEDLPKVVPAAHPALTPVVDDNSPQAQQLIEEGRELAEELTKAEETAEEVVEVQHRNVFKDARSANSHFDYDEEIPKRSPDKPYIITHDEFLENAAEYEQLSFTYYEEDDVLADEQDKPINDTDSVVGNSNLLEFGRGSHDKNLVHVRNEKLELDFEIARSDGSFSKEVYGFVEHSDDRRPRIRRMRRSDDG